MYKMPYIAYFLTLQLFKNQGKVRVSDMCVCVYMFMVVW